MPYEKLKIFTDGGARGNPGPSGIGYVIYSGSEKIKEGARFIGVATNNQAEYKAVVAAINQAKELEAKELEFFLDSELVVKQLNREYRVKDKNLAPLFVSVYNAALGFRKVTFKHIPREQNKEADALANFAMDRGE